jgi:SSS family solute:Na+ symporter
MYSIHIIDIAIVVSYLLICLFLGFRKENRIKNLKEYAIGSGKISTFALIAMIFSTHIGAGATVGEVERVYSLGMFYAAAFIFNPLFWIITSKTFSKNIERFRGCISLTDIMHKLYGSVGRWVAVCLSIVISLGVVAVQLSAIGFLFEHFFAMDFVLGVVIGGFIICLYVAFGGAKAIIITDIFQFVIFYIAIPLACALAFAQVNGIEGLVQKLPADMLALDLEGAKLWLFVSFLFNALVPETTNTLVQKFLMAENSQQLRLALNRIFFLNFPFIIVLCLIGFTIKALAPDIEPNHAFFYLISHYFPVGVIGFIICGILAVIMSTANSWINSAATIFTRDIVQLVKPHINETQKLMIARISTVVISSIAVLIAVRGSGIMQLIWWLNNIWGPIMIVPIILGFTNFKTSQFSFIVSSIISVAVTLITAYFTGEFDTLNVFLGVVASFVTFVAIHYYQLYTNKIKNKRGSQFIANTIKGVVEFCKYFSLPIHDLPIYPLDLRRCD